MFDKNEGIFLILFKIALLSEILISIWNNPLRRPSTMNETAENITMADLFIFAKNSKCFLKYKETIEGISTFSPQHGQKFESSGIVLLQFLQIIFILL